MALTSRVLYVLGWCLVIAWALLFVATLVGVIVEGCLNASSLDSPPGTDCGDVRRGWFFVNAALGIVAGAAAGLLMLPHWMVRRKRRREPTAG